MQREVPNHCQQVSLHQLKQQIKVFLVDRPHNSFQPDDILMVKLLEHFNLPISTLCIDAISKCPENLLQSVFLPIFSALNLPNVPICPAAHELAYFEEFKDVWVDVLAHLNYMVIYYHSFLCLWL